MWWIKKCLGIADLEKRQSGMEEVINHLIVHLTEARENIEKLSSLVLAYQLSKPDESIVKDKPKAISRKK